MADGEAIAGIRVGLASDAAPVNARMDRQTGTVSG